MCLMNLGKLAPERPLLWPVERFLRNVIIVLGSMDLAILFVRDVAFDWFSYSLFSALGCLIILTGLGYRLTGRSERISMTLMATGMLLLFTIVLSVFNYFLLPLWREPIDPLLAAIDTWFGYSWPDIVDFAGHHPVFNEITRYAYLSSIPQMALLFIILGFGGKQKELHVFILSITGSALGTLVFWALFPAFGTTVLYDISGAIEETAKPLVGSAYGAELLRLGAEGPTFITPADIEGLVAFPSYHTIMAVLAVYASRTLPRLFPIILVMNGFVLPGVLIHGGHHFIDLIGGLFFACGTIVVTRNIVTEEEILPDGVFVAAQPKSATIPIRTGVS